jgi:hypothetical protein
MSSLQRGHSGKSFVELLIPGMSPVLLLESESGFEIVTQFANTGQLPSCYL